MLAVPVGTRFVIDFGEGQLVTATVRRSAKHQQGIEFEQTMVSDGNGGLCTRHRVSPYLIAAAAQQTGAPALPTFTTTGAWKAAWRRNRRCGDPYCPKPPRDTKDRERTRLNSSH